MGDLHVALQEDAYSPPATTTRRGTRQRIRARLSVEVVLETLFLVLVGGVFAYMLVDSLPWHPDAARLPRIASVTGLLVLVLYATRRLRWWGVAGASQAILDLGFDEAGLTRQTIVRRTLRFVLTTVALYVGCWLIGFHSAIPLYVFGYLAIWGRVPWYWCLAAAVAFELYMVLPYDLAIHATWPEPLFGPFDK